MTMICFWFWLFTFWMMFGFVGLAHLFWFCVGMIAVVVVGLYADMKFENWYDTHND